MRTLFELPDVSVFSGAANSHHGSFPLKALRFIATFLMVSVTVTVAALTAMFTFWSLVPAQPGTATALFMLFLFAPGLGIASGLFMGARSAGATFAQRPSNSLLAALAAVVGGLAGYGGAMAAIDLTYVERWNNPASAPAWLPYGPPVAGVALAIILPLLVLLPGGKRET